MVEDFFTKKKSRLSTATVKALLRAGAAPGESLRHVIRHARSARSAFLKVEALQLTAALLQAGKVGHQLLCPFHACFFTIVGDLIKAHR